MTPTNEPAALHTLYTWADYAVLATLASERTMAAQLDGRYCKWIYESARHRINWRAMSESELAFVCALGIEGRP